MRIFSMVMMLAVLYMLWDRARDPALWRWLAEADDQGAEEPAETAPPAPPQPGAAAGKSEPAVQGQPSPQKVATEPAAKGPTDEDPDEQTAIREEFQAITDRSLQINPEEMFAYRRVLQWVLNQPMSVLRKRARKDLTFNDFMTSPDKCRGALVELVLNAGLVTDCDLRSPDGSDLYEVWGHAVDSGSWLYDTVVVNLPEGMPVGRRVSERVRFVGYFFKLQGYHEAGAKPYAPPISAPMFIGRLIWIRPEPPLPSTWNASWALIVVGGFALVVVLQLAWLFFGPRRRKSKIRAVGEPKLGALEIDQWMDRGEEGTAPAADDSSESPSSPDQGDSQGEKGEGKGEQFSHPLDEEPGGGG